MRRTYVLLMAVLFLAGALNAVICVERESDLYEVRVGREESIYAGEPVKGTEGDADGSLYLSSAPVRNGNENGSGGSWFQSGRNDLMGCLKNGVTVTGYGADARVNLTLVDDEGWTEVPLDNHPSARHAHKMVYDALNRNIVMFGGLTNTGASSAETWLYDTSKRSWDRVYPPSSPTARYHQSMVYHDAGNKIVMFGGYWVAADTWVYEPGRNTWSQMMPEIHPERLYGHAMAYDSDTEKIVLFGGRTYDHGWRNRDRTWLYDLASNTWSEVFPAEKPSPRYYQDMVYDPVTKKMVLFGGNDGHYRRDTWTYDVVNNVWTEVERNSLPAARAYASMVYDEEIGRVMMYGGHYYDWNVWLYDTTGNEWTRKVYDERPYRRHSTGMVYDTRAGKTVMFGGYHNYMEDTWEYDHYRYPSAGTLTSPLITLPAGNLWDGLHVDKTESPGTFLNLTIIDAATSTPVPGFDNLPFFRTDLSGLNDLGMPGIRLVAKFKADGGSSPILHSWGVEWREQEGWHMGFSGSADIVRTPLPDNATSALWHLDEDGGQIVFDSSELDNHGWLGGSENEEPGDPAWVEGISGSGLLFDGRNDYVWVEKDQSLLSDELLSVEAWFRADSLQRRMTILGTRGNGDYSISVLPNGSVEAQLCTIDLNPDNYNILHSARTVRAGQWHHVTLLFDRPTMKLYLDGAPEASLHADHPVRHSGVPLFIGCDAGSSDFPYDPTDFFSGRIDAIHISRKASTQQNLSLHSGAGLSLHGGAAALSANYPTARKDTIFHYPFREVNSTRIFDSGPGRVTGVLEGSRRLVEGPFGTALLFNGSSPVIRVNDCTRTHPGNATFEFRIKFSSSTGSSMLFSEELPGGGGINEGGYIDAGGKPHYTFGNGAWDIAGTEPLEADRWIHLAFVRHGNIARIYADGEKVAEGNYADFDPALAEPLYIGGTATGGGSFPGYMDDVLCTGRALGDEEIMEHAKQFHSHTLFRTESVRLPGSGPLRGGGAYPDFTWESFVMECKSADNTTIRAILYDDATGEPILEVRPNSTFVNIDLGGLNSANHSALYVEVEMSSNGRATPRIGSLGLRWDPVVSPVFSGPVPEQFIIREDETNANITDLSTYYDDVYSHHAFPLYRVEHNSDPGNVTLSIKDDWLVVSGLTENWTGVITTSVNCTNAYGRTSSSNIFTILVADVDDGPIWCSTPPPIILAEDSNVTLQGFLSPHVFDTEGSELEFEIVSHDPNVTAALLDNDTVFIEPAKDFHGPANITATVFETMEPTLSANISIHVMVKPVNDPPVAVLLKPVQNTILTGGKVRFEWHVTDIDTPEADITYDFYLSRAISAIPMYPEIRVNYLELDDIEDGTTYYWSVIPHDGIEQGTCANGTWSFAMNSTVIIPEAVHMTPLNGTVIDATTVNLTWRLSGAVMPGVSYRVYLGSSPDDLSEHGRTFDTWITLSNLSDLSMYYWRVIPYIVDIEGFNTEGPRSFFVDTSFVPQRSLLMELSKEQINITQGDNATFEAILRNDGNVPLLVEMNVKSPLRYYVSMVNRTLVSVGEEMEISIRITNTGLLEARSYPVTVKASFEGGIRAQNLTMNIISARLDTGQERKVEEDPWPWLIWVLTGAVVTIILIFLVVIIRMKRGYEKELERKEKREELELLEADIVRPIGSTVQAPPPMLPTREPRQSLPQFSGSAPQARQRMETHQLPQKHFTGAENIPVPQLPEMSGMHARPPVPSPAPAPPPPTAPGPMPPPAPSIITPDLEKGAAGQLEMKKLPPAPSSGIEVPRIHAPLRGRKVQKRPVIRQKKVPYPPKAVPEPEVPPEYLPPEEPVAPAPVQEETPSTYDVGVGPAPVHHAEAVAVKVDEPAPVYEAEAAPVKVDEPVVIDTSSAGGGSVLDSLSALLENMPEKFDKGEN